MLQSYKKPIENSKLVDEKTVRELFSNIEAIYGVLHMRK